MLPQGAHPDDDILLLFADDQLSVSEEHDIKEHLTGCAACTTRLDDIHRVLADVSAVYADEDDAMLARERRSRFETALQRTAAAQRAEHLGDRMVRWQTQALAAAALIVAAVVVPAIWYRDTAPDTLAAAANPLPDRSLTPGAVSTMSAQELCAGARPSRVVTAATRDRVLRSYRMDGVHASEYELDALITPELGGTTEAANLWPQRYESPLWTAHVKDELEDLLPALVCRGEIDLARAQQEIATDWVAAYQRHFKTAVPLNAHVVTPNIEQNELIVEGTTVREVVRRGQYFGPSARASVLLVRVAR